MEIEAGQRIGDYEVIRALGAGGLGAVYQVRHLISGRTEAMKMMLPDRLHTPELAERFRREVQVLATLNHVNIAGLHNAFYQGEQLVMVMEFVKGRTLTSLTKQAPVPVTHAIHWISQVLSALSAAHAAGIVHRDVKPSNIMLTDAGLIKLLDFGIAISGSAPHLTQTGMLVGSLHYMSPEQLSGAPVTLLSDIYSVGITLYELVTRQLPFSGSTAYEIMTAHLYKAPVPAREINPDIPLWLSSAIQRALAKEPAQRFASAEEFRLALQQQASDTTQTQVTTRPATSSSTQSALPLDEITKQLAIHVGPVAKFIIKKLAATCTNMNDLYAAAAKEIASAEGRAQFLGSRRQ